MRRHRRDAGFLRWVLRSVAASSALAVALLGLGAAPAQARATLFGRALTGAANPLAGQDIGLLAAPAAGDLDADGDLDLVSGETSGRFFVFENVAGELERTSYVAGLLVPELDVGVFSTPAFGDLDGVADLDLVSGEYDGTFHYFRNFGSAADPILAELIGFGPVEGLDVGLHSAPALGDLDGDLDLVADAISGTFVYLENTGNPTAPVFVARTGAANLLGRQDAGTAAALGDLDGDRDLDLVAGLNFGVPRYFENTGSAASPSFARAPARTWRARRRRAGSSRRAWSSPRARRCRATWPATARRTSSSTPSPTTAAPPRWARSRRGCPC